MQKVAKFQKVSFAQFLQDWQSAFGSVPNNLQEIYDAIILPKRATARSAGYDIFSPISFSLAPKQQILIPTGIRAQICDGTFLAIVPRSGHGFRFRLQLNNTVGVIDADYYDAANQGHIMMKLYNDTAENKTFQIQAGTGVVQGIFLPFGITFDDNATAPRTGGFGSTTKSGP